MRFKDVRVGFAVTGSHCTLDEVMVQVARLVQEGALVHPIVSAVVDETDTRFGPAAKWKDMLEKIAGKPVINSIVGAEPIGPGKLLDVVVVAPCTGNTLAKLAGGITDTPVLMAVKAHLRNLRPVVLAVSTNDGLGMNAKNIGLLLNTKNIYMVPFGQDSPQGKPNSLKAKMDLIPDTVLCALEGKQIQPVLINVA
ncbi:dipicolinate synthase subunit B [Desulfofundulus thermobenzoicus]|uniref:Dipicolinate synthase subunit B n=1 Tax=Desulfofundulus thermobenzoicus TaxID=29376 RepID=A0A6N7ISK3_9FIRM|nr:dipicolinate synthase subunit B [Desulfofundulus thermobenzoicus]MQL52437.1 dipicolinate synthase subunit B [Desulfofundulus thermobenzoicus]HHW42213.1 dipicolinate synthase subunit B [Desulfotomaculum sp.]